jgi:hypothetical protein
MGICGTNAGELIAEPTLAIEMGCDMSDIALTIHAHPTLSETDNFSGNFGFMYGFVCEHWLTDNITNGVDI